MGGALRNRQPKHADSTGPARSCFVQESDICRGVVGTRLGRRRGLFRGSPGLPALQGLRVPEAGRTLRESDPAIRLVFAGDPARGIAPCSACHGPGGYKLGAPALQRQRTPYIERQLGAFAQGLRQDDISEQMRTIAKELTPEEMQAVALYYGAEGAVRTTQK